MCQESRARYARHGETLYIPEGHGETDPQADAAGGPRLPVVVEEDHGEGTVEVVATEHAACHGRGMLAGRYARIMVNLSEVLNIPSYIPPLPPLLRGATIHFPAVRDRPSSLSCSLFVRARARCSHRALAKSPLLAPGQQLIAPAVVRDRPPTLSGSLFARARARCSLRALCQGWLRRTTASGLRRIDAACNGACCMPRSRNAGRKVGGLLRLLQRSMLHATVAECWQEGRGTVEVVAAEHAACHGRGMLAGRYYF